MALRNVAWGVYLVLTAPAQNIWLGHQLWTGGRNTRGGILDAAGLLGLATAVEWVRVGGACWGLGVAATSWTPRRRVLSREATRLMLSILPVGEEGERGRESSQHRI